MLLVPLVYTLALTGCSGETTKDDTGGGTDTSETGESGETGETGETGDTDPGTASVSGMTTTWSGTPAAGAEMQFCETVCYYGSVEADGSFLFTDKFGGSYKLDVLGQTLSTDLGWIRFHIELAPGEAYTVPDTVFLPHVYGPESLASGSATFDNVTVTASGSDLEVPFGFDEDQYWAGWVGTADVPSLWGVEAVGAVSMSPLATTVSGPLGVSVTESGLADGTYDVYSVEAHGEAEGPVGTATVSGGTLTATGLTPTILSWLLFVPQG